MYYILYNIFVSPRLLAQKTYFNTGDHPGIEQNPNKLNLVVLELSLLLFQYKNGMDVFKVSVQIGLFGLYRTSSFAICFNLQDSYSY